MVIYIPDTLYYTLRGIYITFYGKEVAIIRCAMKLTSNFINKLLSAML
jgi:hypothetical protein